MLDLVGIPYRDKGLEPKTGLDCFGLIRYVLNRELGFTVPEVPPSVAAWPNYVKVYRQPKLPPLRCYDLVMFDGIIPGLTNHIGIMVSSVDFIHTDQAHGGVVCEPIGRYYNKNLIAVGRPL